MLPNASANRARSIGSRSQPRAAIASNRARASLQVAALLPEPPQRERACWTAIGGSCSTIQSSAARRLSWSRSSRSCHIRWSAPRRCGSAVLRQGHERLGVAPRDDVRLAPGREHLGGVLADRLEHREARLDVGRGLVLEPDQALVLELADPVDDVATDLVGGAADRLGHRQVEPATEHGQPIEQPPRAVVEQVVAPGDRPAQGLLSLGQVARPGGQRRQVVVEAGQDLVGREQLDPRGGELDGQRHAVQPRGDPGDGRAHWRWSRRSRGGPRSRGR